jgi:hypothetical protein
VRERVVQLRERLATGLSTLSAVVAGNTRAAALRLEEYRDLCLPLLASDLVGESQGVGGEGGWGVRLMYDI